MAHIKVELDQATYEALVERAVDERRPIPWQAEVMLRDLLSRRRGSAGGQARRDGCRVQEVAGHGRT